MIVFASAQKSDPRVVFTKSTLAEFQTLLGGIPRSSELALPDWSLWGGIPASRCSLGLHQLFPFIQQYSRPNPWFYKFVFGPVLLFDLLCLRNLLGPNSWPRVPI